MKVRTRKRRRNYKHRSIRRLHGVVNAQAVTIGALRAQVQGLGGKLLVQSEMLDATSGDACKTRHTLEDERLALIERISTLERVPRWLRTCFGAR